MLGIDEGTGPPDPFESKRHFEFDTVAVTTQPRLIEVQQARQRQPQPAKVIEVDTVKRTELIRICFTAQTSDRRPHCGCLDLVDGISTTFRVWKEGVRYMVERDVKLGASPCEELNSQARAPDSGWRYLAE